MTGGPGPLWHPIDQYSDAALRRMARHPRDMRADAARRDLAARAAAQVSTKGAHE